jgi:extracellular matrix regulatory protein A
VLTLKLCISVTAFLIKMSYECKAWICSLLLTPISMSVQLVNVGFGNIASTQRIVAIVSPDSAPIKRNISEARDRGQLIDGTYGRRTRAVLIMDSGHVLLSAIQPETIASRIQG